MYTEKITLDVAAYTNKYLFENIKLADAKASSLLVANGGLLGWAAVRTMDTLSVRGNGWPVTVIMMVVAGIPLIVGYLAALDAVTPRTASTRKKGLVYWQEIKNHDGLAEYIRASRALDVDAAVEMLAESNWVLAAVTKQKFDRIRQSIWAFSLGAGLLILTVVVAATLVTA